MTWNDMALFLTYTDTMMLNEIVTYCLLVLVNLWCLFYWVFFHPDLFQINYLEFPSIELFSL